MPESTGVTMAESPAMMPTVEILLPWLFLPCTLQEDVHGHDHVAAVVQGLDDPDQEHDRTIGRKGGGKTAQEP